MAIADDFIIDYGTKTITLTPTSQLYTGSEIYKALADMFEDEEIGKEEARLKHLLR